MIYLVLMCSTLNFPLCISCFCGSDTKMCLLLITVIIQVFAKPLENSKVTCRLVDLFGVFLIYFLPHGEDIIVQFEI